MNPGTRYILANCRLAALADQSRWTEDDVLDVAALAPSPSVPYEEWLRRRDALAAGAQVEPPGVPVEDVEDPVTTASMQAILSGKADDLIKAGILSVKEVKAA